MVTLVVVCCGLLSALPPEADAGGPAPDLASYEAAYDDARAKVGRDADAHVRLALWCEAHGLPAERLKHLAIAALIEPGHATARGLMGLVAHAGGWKRPEAVADRLKADAELGATLEQYRARRDRTPVKAEDQWKLALWCEENGLEAEAKAHLTIVTRIDPDHAAARKRLGYRKQGGRWVTDAQLAEEKAEAELQKKADRAWKPRLEKYRAMLAGKDEAKRAEAEAGAPGGDRPARRAGGLGRLRERLGGPSGDRGPVAGPDRRSGVVASPGDSGRLQPRGRGPPDRHPDALRRDPRDFVGMLVETTARSDQVRGPAGRRAGLAGSPLSSRGRNSTCGASTALPRCIPRRPAPVVQLGVPFDPARAESPFWRSDRFGDDRELNVTPQDVRGHRLQPAECARDTRPECGRPGRDTPECGQHGRWLPAAGPRVIRSGAGNYYDLVECSLFYEMQAAQRDI